MFLRILQVVFILSVIIFLNTSCRKKKKGCIDEFAANYNSEAELSDNTCVYQRTFWDDYNQAGWIDIWVTGADSANSPLRYEGRITAFYTGTVPGCNAAGSVYVLRKPGEYSYSTENDKGNLRTGTVLFRQEACRMFEVNY
jgi:hypothetical protein